MTAPRRRWFQFSLKRIGASIALAVMSAGVVRLCFFEPAAEHWLVHECGGDWGMIFLLLSPWLTAGLAGASVGVLFLRRAWAGAIAGASLVVGIGLMPALWINR